MGRWQQSHICDELVTALTALGLEARAPGVVGDYFADTGPPTMATTVSHHMHPAITRRRWAVLGAAAEPFRCLSR